MTAAARIAWIAALALAALAAPATPAFAEEEEAEEESGGEEEEEGGEEEVVDAGDGKPKPKKAKKDEFKKQDLRGHAVEASSAKNVFEKDRFFVDKVDSKKTAKRTLVQGSISSSSFLYDETGGQLTGNFGSAAAKYRRVFTELRLQTDFRHIGGGKWDARIDTRGRLVNSPAPTSMATASPTRIQSGFNGENEVDLRELWLVRSGKRSDLFFGRQFITDLGALKIDGLRVDYAKSEQLTFIIFGGLYPLRGSRSLTTDYTPLKANDGTPAGRFIGSGGFGTAYRTLNMHGAFGGVAIVPLSSESPRVYATSNGYYRGGSKFDLYHFAIVDLVGSAGFSLTNLSAGGNFKPSQRLRLTASFNRVDTETLNVQANAFLQQGETGAALGGDRVQNETFITRLSTNVARAGVSAGLGSLQRFEVSTAASYRLRPEVSLNTPGGMAQVLLPAAKGVDVYFSVMDRRSIANLRSGFDVSRSFAVGNVAFQRSEVLAARVFAAREIKNGRGEWEAEVGYSTTKDSAGGTTCTTTTVSQCFGTSNGSTLSIGGNLYYRINSDWFALGNLFLNRQNITTLAGTDPPITGVTGFARIAYRF